MTIVSDSCHSGGLIEDAKEQIGHSTESGGGESSAISGLTSLLKGSFGGFGVQEAEQEGLKNKSLPISTLIDILQQKTGKDDIQVGQLRPTLFDIFGEDSSPKVKKFMKAVLDNFQGGGGGGFMGFIGGIAKDFLKNDEVVSSQSKKGLSDNGALISGCQSDQTSADANPTGDPSDAYGALSNAIQTVLSESDGEVSNKELVTKVRKMLVQQGFSQQPGLYCNDELADAPFIC